MPTMKQKVDRIDAARIDIIDAVNYVDDTKNLPQTTGIESIAAEVRTLHGNPVLQNKTITENGTYSADAGYDGLGNVVVNVQSGIEVDLNDKSFDYLFYQGRLLELIDIAANSTQENYNSLTFQHFADSAKVSTEQMQKLLNIFANKCANGGTSTAGGDYAFNNIKCLDNDNILYFKPIGNFNTNRYFNWNYLFAHFNNNSNVKVYLIADFENVKTQYGISGNNAFGEIKYNYCEFEVLNLQSNQFSGISFNVNSGYSGLKRLTVKSYLKGTWNLNTCIYMPIENWVEFFNSVDTASSSAGTINIPKTIYNQLTEEQKAIIIDKGYTLAYAS